MLEKPKKPKSQSKKGMFDHRWPKQRSLNIEKMIKRMQRDEAYLFYMASEFLNQFSDVPWRLGDENMSILIAWIGAQMHSRYHELKKGPKKVPRRRR